VVNGKKGKRTKGKKVFKFQEKKNEKKKGDPKVGQRAKKTTPLNSVQDWGGEPKKQKLNKKAKKKKKKRR